MAPKATVTGQVSMKSGKMEKGQTSATKVNLVSSEGTWQIVPEIPKAQQTTDPDMVNGLAYMLTDPKVFAKAREKARATACLSNVKQICLAAMMLVQDYDEVFKLKAETYKKSLMPYCRRRENIHVPGRRQWGRFLLVQRPSGRYRPCGD